MLQLPLLLQIIVGCLLGGVLSMLAAAAVMFGLPRRYLPMAVSFSAGLLLSNALLHLLPEAMEGARRSAIQPATPLRQLLPQIMEGGLTPHEVFPLLLAGILGFFLLERFTFWRHAHHDDGCPHAAEQSRQTTPILLGDSFHNFTDGILLAAAFLADPVLGWTTTAAIVAHEVPKEAGDFAILLASGWNRKRALFWNGIASLTNTAGGVIGYFALEYAQGMVPVVITLAAAGFIYISVSDLLPRLRGEQSATLTHSILIGCGVLVVVLVNGHSH